MKNERYFQPFKPIFQIKIFIHAHFCGIIFLKMHFTVNINNSKLQYRNRAASWSKSYFSVRLGFETELNGHTPVGSWRCQPELALLALTCQCLRQIKVNQICVRGLLLRALSHCSWQQWALWWIAVLSMKPHLSVQSEGEKSTCVCAS